MTQTAPYPHALRRLVKEVTYRSGFSFHLIDNMERGQGSDGLTLIIDATVENSLPPGREITVSHLFIVPAASYNRRTWMRWLLDRCLDVDVHEGCELFQINGERVYAPHHSEGEDPYTIFEVSHDPVAAGKRSIDK